MKRRLRFQDLEQTFKFWVSGTEAGRHMLWQAWGAIDYNGNGIVSLAEIDKWVVESYPKLNNKPALASEILAAWSGGFDARLQIKRFGPRQLCEQARVPCPPEVPSKPFVSACLQGTSSISTRSGQLGRLKGLSDETWI